MMNIEKSISEEQILAAIRASHHHTKKIKLALEQAKKSHKNQIREDGEPYLTEHIYPVTKIALEFFMNHITENIIISCLLHDALEDDKTLSETDIETFYGEDVRKILSCLSKPNLPELRKLSETERRDRLNKKYFEQLSNSSYETKVIKLIDRIDNLFWAKTFGEELIRIYIKETSEFYLPLAKNTNNNLYLKIKELLDSLKQTNN